VKVHRGGRATNIIKPSTTIGTGGDSIRNLDVIADQVLVVSGIVLTLVRSHFYSDILPGLGVLLVFLSILEYVHGVGVENKKSRESWRAQLLLELWAPIGPWSCFVS
jgi:hypothetical protein